MGEANNMDTTPDRIKAYKKQINAALGKRFLGKTLDNFAASYKVSRENAFAGIDLENLKSEIAAGKDAAISNLETLFEGFKANAEAAGVRVHLAAHAQEANEIIAGIAKENGVKNIIKSKSMTSEEIFLNPHLEKEGLTVTESDLGEWIIQMRGEGPSHMVMPAIHLSRYDVGDLFFEVTKEKQDPENIDAMVRVARKKLRPKYIEAEMGITGGNFAVADSGTMGIVTNEGNARLTSTLPRIHVALMGLDKLVPDLKSALRILKVLPRNATGQAITSYVTWIRGANECAPGPDGKKQMHVVFLDNGRLELANDPIFAQALRCVRCGACANVCPVYRMVGGHVFGHVYIGAIGLILTLFYHGIDKARAIVKNCLNCQSCKSVCPAGIDLPHLIKQVAKRIMDQEGGKPAKNHLLSMAMGNRRVFHFLLRAAAKAQTPVAKDGYIRHLPSLFGKAHNFRSLPALAKAPLRDQWEKLAPGISHPKYKVAFFGGCVIDFVYPEQGRALLTLMADKDVQVDFPMDQTCCGLPALMMGENQIAVETARQNIKALAARDYDYILVLCASCGSHLKENYPKLMTAQFKVPPHVKEFSDKVIDFSSFMVDVLKVETSEFKGSGQKVTYHSPCHLCRGMGVTEQPRELLKIAGVNYLPSVDEDVCCGFGGSYSVDFPELSSRLLNRKLDKAEESRAEVLATDCPGCVMQIRGGMAKRGGAMAVKHIVEVLADKKC